MGQPLLARKPLKRAVSIVDGWDSGAEKRRIITFSQQKRVAQGARGCVFLRVNWASYRKSRGLIHVPCEDVCR